MPPQGRPQAVGRSSQFQPGKYVSSQKASQKPARSQPEANETSFFLIARSQPNQAREG